MRRLLRRDGDLYVADAYLRRIDAQTGTIAPVRVEDAPDGRTDVIFPRIGPDGRLCLVLGDPSGVRVLRLTPDFRLEAVVGTGRISRQRDGVPATSVGILPGPVAFAPDGAILVPQTQPVPAIRRVDPRTGRITTLLR